MKIGIFMAYGPQTHMGREGLGRYIGGLIKGFSDAGASIVITIPRWSRQTLSELLYDFGVPENAVELAILDRIPAFWGLYSLLERYRSKRKIERRYRVLRKAVDLLEALIALLINITSMVVLSIVGLLLCAVAILLLPVALVGFLLCLLVLLLKRIVGKRKLSVKALYKRAMKITEEVSKSGQNISAYTYDRMMDSVEKRLVKKANRQDVDVWFVPTLFWPETRQLKKTRVVTVPDLVTREFSTMFSDEPAHVVPTEKCSRTIVEGEYFICYCNYIKESLLERQFGKKGAHVIHHVNNALDWLIMIDPSMEKRLNASKNFTDGFARSLLQTLPKHAKHAEGGLANYSFQDTRYIFYPSQARPHKNLLGLIRAYEELLRKRYIDVKLFLTCDLKRHKQAYEYVMNQGLQLDVICFCGVSAQQLAALYRCADLVVNPTLYEGGFPFTFGEGMSVGTPSIMSDIPQVRDVVESFGLSETMLFDPYDWRSIADKIEFGLRHKKELYQKELPLYRELEKRTVDVVAEEYIHAFEFFIEQDKRRNAG